MRNKLIYALTIATMGGLVAVGAYKLLESKEPRTFEEKQKVHFTSLANYAEPADGPLDFTVAAAKTVPAVVHIKVTMSESPQASYFDPFRDFFGDRGPGFPFGQRGPSMSSGSGVIISQDGYIVTNNHVVNGADKIEVILNDKRSYKGKIIGTDPNTDLALLKIEATELPYMVYGNSDDLKIGEWVLAVGNPFNLTSTVTAGIVSAKARNINILENNGQTPSIESFIQTDAAVNPGNSGGALVNTRGELVGINTAIASQTGSYAGYSFAVPVNLAKKVMDDLLQYGKVQRAFIGVQISDINSQFADEKGLKSTKGVYVAGITDGGAAQAAGLKQGDVITRIEGVEVNSVSQLQEQIGRHRPGDKVDVSLVRENKERSLALVLRGEGGSTELAKKEEINTSSLLGANFSDLTSAEKKNYRIESGVKVSGLSNGKLSSVGIRQGFIITKMDDKAIDSPEDIENAIRNNRNGMLKVEGIYPQNPNSKYVFAFNVK
jgi:serine protease Do